jgi:hypothetical protein
MSFSTARVRLRPKAEATLAGLRVRLRRGHALIDATDPIQTWPSYWFPSSEASGLRSVLVTLRWLAVAGHDGADDAAKRGRPFEALGSTHSIGGLTIQDIGIGL